MSDDEQKLLDVMISSELDARSLASAYLDRHHTDHTAWASLLRLQETINETVKEVGRYLEGY